MLYVLWIAFRHIHGVIDSRESFKVRQEFRERRIRAVTRLYELEGFWLDDALRAGLELKQAMETYTEVKRLAVDLQWFPDRPIFNVGPPVRGRTRSEDDGPEMTEWAEYYRMENGAEKIRRWRALMDHELCRFVAFGNRHIAVMEPLVQVWKVLSLRATPVAVQSLPKPVVLHGQGKRPEVLGVEVDPLNASDYRIIQALLDAGDEGLSKDKIDAKANVTNGPTNLRRLRMQAERTWGLVIKMAGEKGKKYRVGWPD
jgi:hypothetical protein